MNFHASAVAGHIAIGSLAILLYWTALLSVKGGPRHRAYGKALLVTMIAVALSVGPVLFLRPHFEPGELVQFVYLTLCVLTVVMLAWTSIRWKAQLARFRGLHFRVVGVALFIFGAVVLAAGIATGRPLTMVFSWIGLVYGAAMIRFAWMRDQPDPRWWLGWHLNGVCGLFNAVHGTFLAVAWRHGVDAQAGDGVAIAMQLFTIAAAAAMRLEFGRRRGVPLRFSTRSFGVLERAA